MGVASESTGELLQSRVAGMNKHSIQVQEGEAVGGVLTTTRTNKGRTWIFV